MGKNVFLSALACNLISFWKLVARGCFAGGWSDEVVLLQRVSGERQIWAQFPAQAQCWAAIKQMGCVEILQSARETASLRRYGHVWPQSRDFSVCFVFSVCFHFKQVLICEKHWMEGKKRDQLSGVTALRNMGFCKALSRLSANSLLSYKAAVSLVDVSLVLFFFSLRERNDIF